MGFRVFNPVDCSWEGPWVPLPGRCLLFPLDCLSLRWSGQFLLPHWARSHNCHACACLRAPPSLIPLSLWLNHGQWCLGLIGTICCYQSLQRGSKKAHFHLCPPTTRDLKEEGAGSYCLMLKALTCLASLKLHKNSAQANLISILATGKLIHGDFMSPAQSHIAANCRSQDLNPALEGFKTSSFCHILGCYVLMEEPGGLLSMGSHRVGHD